MSNPKDAGVKKIQNEDKNLPTDKISQSRNSACYQPGGSKFFGPLENSAPLEDPKFIYQSPIQLPVIATDNSPQLLAKSTDSMPLMAESTPLSPSSNLDLASSFSPLEKTETDKNLSNTSKLPLLEETLSLLEERLVIDSHKRKVGEVIVRKEIETRIVEVPIRREKLIVEQISPTFKQLVVVDLGQIDETEFDQTASIKMPRLDTTAHEFDDANAAIQFLEAIAAHPAESQQPIHISIMLNNRTDQPFNS
ncbi:DUF2382 domain-containing protein [Leptolyngbyaceae cyanobacterium UHCC 1019]